MRASGDDPVRRARRGSAPRASCRCQHDPRLDDEARSCSTTGSPRSSASTSCASRSRRRSSPHPDKQPEAKLKVVARTTAEAWSETSETVDLKISPQLEAQGAARAKGDRHHRRGHAQERHAASGDGVETPAASKDKSRVLVISSARFLDQPVRPLRRRAPMLGGQFAMMGPVGGDEQLQMLARPVRAEVPDRDHPRVQEHARLDERRLGSHRREREDPRRSRTSPTTASRSPKHRRERRRQLASRRRTRSSATLARTRNATSSSCSPCSAPCSSPAFGIFRWRQREGGRANITLD